MLKCKSCGLEKDPSLFYVSNKSRCKECVKTSVTKNREENKEYYLEYDRNRPNREERNLKNIERGKTKYSQDPEYRDKVQKTKTEWVDRNPMKRKAQHTLSNAVRDSKIIKPSSCEHCAASEKKIQGHHWSYAVEHWLDVIWLCTSCHGKEHKRLNDLGRDPDKQ